MVKLTNILRELFTTHKNTANFELLTELKISEIDNMLDEAVPGEYLSLYGKDLEKVKPIIEKWIIDWKKKHKDEILPSEKPISSDLEQDNNDFYNYIRTYFIRTKLTTWEKLGFSEIGRYTYIKTVEDAKKAIEEWKTIWNETNNSIPSREDLKKFKGSLYQHIKKWFIDEKNITWEELGFPLKEITGTYSYIKTVEDAKKAIEEWKIIFNKNEPSVTDLQRSNNKLYERILDYILSLMDGKDFLKWQQLGLKSIIQWHKFTKEDFKEIIKELKKIDSEFKKNNYIYMIRNNYEKLYAGMYNYMKKQNFKAAQRRDFWNKLGLKYAPLGERMIYAYEFRDVVDIYEDGTEVKNNFVYVGLTNDPERRNKEHLSLSKLTTQIQDDENKIEQEETNKAIEGPDILAKEQKQLKTVARFIKLYNINPNQVEQVQKSEFMDVFEAADKEGEILKEYIKEGWIPINRTATGSIGGLNYKRIGVRGNTIKRETNPAWKAVVSNIASKK